MNARQGIYGNQTGTKTLGPAGAKGPTGSTGPADDGDETGIAIKGKKVVYMPVPYNKRRCRDYVAYSQKELREVFGHNYTRGYDRDMVYSLAWVIMQKYKSLDCLAEPIPFSDIQSFSMELVSYLARSLAIYMIVPQQFGHRSRNMLASAFMLFTRRIQKYRSGHGLPFVKGELLTKKELGHLIDFINNTEYLWQLSEHWVERYHQRVRRGHTYSLDTK